MKYSILNRWGGVQHIFHAAASADTNLRAALVSLPSAQTSTQPALPVDGRGKTGLKRYHELTNQFIQREAVWYPCFERQAQERGWQQQRRRQHYP